MLTRPDKKKKFIIRMVEKHAIRKKNFFESLGEGVISHHYIGLDEKCWLLSRIATIFGTTTVISTAPLIFQPTVIKKTNMQ